MEVEDIRSFPTLPELGQPTMSVGNVTRLQRGVSWVPAQGGRPMMGLQGGSLGRGMPRPHSLPIQSEELDRRIKEASTSGNWTAYSSMRAYIREAHALQKEM